MAAAGGTSGRKEIQLAPWLDHKGRLIEPFWQELVKRVMKLLLCNPGIPEPLLLSKMRLISPSCAAQLLECLVHQELLLVHEVEAKSPADADPVSGAGSRPPSLLGGRRKRSGQNPQQLQIPVMVKHYWPALKGGLTAHLTAKAPEFLVV